MSDNQLYILLLSLAGLQLVSLGAIAWLFFRLRSTLGGLSADTLAKKLADYFKVIKSVESRHAELITEYNRLADMAALSAQKISVYRFNPFGDTGGDQSFALAVLDAHSSGYVLTSIHGRGGTRVYIKPIDYGKSKYTLSKEEQKALEQAQNRTPRK